ncbi:MAG: hypothetical protein WCX31_21200 [Salinivirgaceae bacterium]|jgi:hypothetical protein
MKKSFILLVVIAFSGITLAQELPSDVDKVYKGAEKLKNKKEYKLAIVEYKEVLRSVNHVPSMVSIGEISMELMSPPNYRMAYEYYDKAIQELGIQILGASKDKEKARLGQQIEELTPKRNRAKSYVDDFDKAKDKKQEGNRLMEGEEEDVD